MEKSYIRYTQETDELDGAFGLLVSALKDPGEIKPEEYHDYYCAGDFLATGVFMENAEGAQATIDDLMALMSQSAFDDGFEWALTAVIFTAAGIEAHYTGFHKTTITMALGGHVNIGYESRHTQIDFGPLRNAKVQIGEGRKFEAKFKAGGEIPKLAGDYEDVDAIVSEYRGDSLIRDYFIYDDERIVVHQYMS